ncbi:unnamed protein product (macronuclear) [Paramecium tetraurelia]|uniref:Uncharacterized protein n=1 Tax=Paramecium tetraurelia TaxID=5888 RepID=A0CQY9_PARTE|nr:uncharacterized protein GSPATT00038862001 [Paramecium tetraurelia]CAK73206.1 unnamed protein product [Paramecium tetraurelia]|eukprot:XP_001440603.1 hypothetical protein (macronuclear) [Paramecium tetraurelia strain d4-2]
MKEISIFHAQICYSLAINQNNTLILAVAESAIKVYTVSSSKIKYVQLLKSHTFEVQTLNFFPNKMEFFLSGSVDSNLVIWSKNLMAQPKIIQKLNGHTSTVYTVVIYCELKNLIVSGGDDSTIKFWTTKQLDLFQWFCFQAIFEDATQVLALSIDKEGQQVVSCTLNYQIFVIEQEQHSIFWYVKQKIDLEWYGCKYLFHK